MVGVHLVTSNTQVILKQNMHVLAIAFVDG